MSCSGSELKNYLSQKQGGIPTRYAALFQCLPLPPQISVISVKIPPLFLPLTQQLKAGDNDTDQDIDEHRFSIGRPGIGVVPAHVQLSVMFEVSGTSRLI